MGKCAGRRSASNRQTCEGIDSRDFLKWPHYKVKSSLCMPWSNTGQVTYDYTSSELRHWLKVSGHAPSILATGKELPISREQEDGWAPDMVWTLWKR
jgi:hypothetical protein